MGRNELDLPFSHHLIKLSLVFCVVARKIGVACSRNIALSGGRVPLDCLSAGGEPFSGGVLLSPGALPFASNGVLT